MKDAEDGIFIKFETVSVDLGDGSNGKHISSLVVVPSEDGLSWEDALCTEFCTKLVDGTYNFKQAMTTANVRGLSYNGPNKERLSNIIGDQGREVDTPLGRKRISIKSGVIHIESLADIELSGFSVADILAKKKMTR